MINWILLALILLVIAFIAIRLLIWNMGTRDVSDEAGADNTAFDIEILDQVRPLAADALEGHEDDGQLTILCLGNNAFSDGRGENSLAEKIAEKTGGVCINGAFPGSLVATRTNPVDTSTNLMDAFSFYQVASSLASGDFQVMSDTAMQMSDSAYGAGVTALQSTDMNKVDMIVVMYDGQDYIQGSPCYDPNDNGNPLAFAGAYDAGLKMIHERYPYIRLVMLTPTFCFGRNAAGEQVNGDMTDLGNGALPTYLTKMIDVSEDAWATMIDNYYGTVDISNYEQYLLDDVHMNEACREVIAGHFKTVVMDGEAWYGN